MNFELTQEQQLLVDTVANFVRRESPVSRARKLREDPVGYSREVWKKMGELGWLGLPFEEEVGGFGGTFVEVALVLEQLGTTLVPEPYLATVVLAGRALQLLGSNEQKQRWLTPAVAGDLTLALAYGERRARYDLTATEARAERSGDSYELYGEKTFVLNGHAADVILVAARTGGTPGERRGLSLFALDRGTPGMSVQTISTLDGQKAGIVRLAGARVGEGHRLGAEGDGLAILERVLDEGAAAACAEGAGINRTVLEMTCDYLRTREQFGVKIGTFQALQHRSVEMFVETELSKATALMAAIKVGDENEEERQGAISAAKAQLSSSGAFVTRQAIQLFGGIGITDEHDVGLYFKRMQVLMSLFGDEEHHLRRYAALSSFTQGIDGISG
ncbi:MAG: acyl-CoA dehydrogenase family protein [Myxococcales bacterium]|nr:acyl-CoA/acyl-ACP dehydrogenase [Polyangiaceae bacterium]MDW8252120.1 acyl-CoA dehydrogenase family protein [Myxococcales bacterium]